MSKQDGADAVLDAFDTLESHGIDTERLGDLFDAHQQHRAELIAEINRVATLVGADESAIAIGVIADAIDYVISAQVSAPYTCSNCHREMTRSEVSGLIPLDELTRLTPELLPEILARMCCAFCRCGVCRRVMSSAERGDVFPNELVCDACAGV